MSAISSLSSSLGGSPATGFSALTSEDFTKIMFSELTRQDPLQPNDTNALLQQISSIRSIQSNVDLSKNLDALVSQNEFSNAATLIGKTVSGLSDNYERVTGEVRTLSRTQYGPVLTLTDGTRVPVALLDQISADSEN